MSVNGWMEKSMQRIHTMDHYSINNNTPDPEKGADLEVTTWDTVERGRPGGHHTGRDETHTHGDHPDKPF